MDTDEGLYQATPQTKGRIAHETVDTKRASNKKSDLQSLPIHSARFGLMGKVDIFKQKEKLLIERKNNLKQIFQGQIYQLWAQYLCLQEMGYDVEQIAFYEISTNKIIPIPLPTEKNIQDFESFIRGFRRFNPTTVVSCKTKR